MKFLQKNLTRVELFMGKHAFLEFVEDDSTSYIIRAYDDDMNVVGCCYFDIESLFQRNLSENERIEKSPFFGGLEKTPKTSEIYVTKATLDKYDIDGKILTFISKGKTLKFLLKFARCRLGLIEIKRRDFFKTGLGTTMLKVMENFATQHFCTSVYAHYQPLGDFSSGSRRFYDRNGFKIEYDPCDHKNYASKELAPAKTNTTPRTAMPDGGKSI